MIFSRSINSKHSLISSSMVVIAGSLWLASAGPAFANHGLHRLHNTGFANKNRNLNRTFQTNAMGRSQNVNGGVDLDLSSVQRNITLGSKLFDKVNSVTIDLNGAEKQLNIGSQVTAAEFVAAKQALTGGQNIVLDNSGRAVGGRIDLGSITAKNDRMRADDLFIPENVSMYGDFGKGSTFQVLGDLTNAGSIYASSELQSRSGTIRATNITNQQSGLIRSSRPSIEVGRKPNSAVDLTLRADNTLSNYGTISGEGNLTLSAGNSIHNHSTISTDGNLTVLAGNVSNNGLMQSKAGNIKLDSPVPATLSINNSDGTIAARNGIVFLRDTTYNAAFNTYLTGGDVLSKELNVNSGTGTSHVSVGNLTGTLNQTGLAAHVLADTETLQLGKICLTGDPTFSNTGGDIQITADLIVNENLALLASGNITNTAPVTISAADANQGFEITIFAGANFTAGGQTVGSVPTATAPVAATINPNLPSATGGNVILGTNAGGAVTINTRATGAPANQNAGDVYIGAFPVAGNGLIDMTGSTINAGGFGSGNNGEVLLYAGGSDPGPELTNKALRVGAINTNGGNSTTGNIQITNAVPGSLFLITFAANGTPDNNLGGGPISSNAGMSFSGNISSGQDLFVIAGDNSEINIENGVQLSAGRFAIFGNSAGTDLVAGALTNITAPEVNFAFNFAGNVGTPANRLLVNTAKISGNVVGNLFLFNSNPNFTQFEISASSIDAVVTGTIMSSLLFPQISATDVTLLSTNGSIGFTQAGPAEVNATNLNVSAPLGNIFIHNQNAGGTTLVGNPSALNTFSLDSDGDISSSSDISAEDIVLSTDGNVDGLLGVFLNASNSVSVTADASIPNGTTIPSAPTVNMRVTTGDIGASGNPFFFGASVKNVNLISDNGSVFAAYANINPKQTLTMSGGSAADQFFFDASTGNPILVTNNITAGTGDLTLQITGSNKITINNNVALNSGEDILLRVTAPTALAKKSIIQLNNGASLTTLAAPGNGHITLSVGDIAGVPVVGVPPSRNVSFFEQGGQIFWGQFSSKTKKPTNVLFAKGANIVFNNPIAGKNITLGGGVTIVADPPVAGAQPTEVTLAQLRQPAMAVSNHRIETDNGASSTSGPGDDSAPIIGFGFDTPTSMNTADLSVRNFDGALIPALASGIAYSDCASGDDNSFITSYGQHTKPHFGICTDGKLFSAIGSPKTFEFTSSSKRATLSTGKTVFAPQQDMEIETPHATINVAAGTVAIVASSSDSLSVYNVHDSRQDAVSLTVAGQKFSVTPGKHLTVSKARQSDFGSVNALESVPHRRLSSRSIGKDYNLHVSEFSIPAALSSVKPLHSIVSSKDKEAIRLAQKMLKTTAVLMHLGSGAEQFQHYLRPTVSALISSSQ